MSSSAVTDPVAPAPLLRAGRLALPGLVHGFSTRRGGVSAGSIGPLNLARRPGETDAALVENWRRVVAALDAGLEVERLALLEQVHGADVARIEGGRGPLEVVARADGAVTATRGVVLTVRTADCVPVMLAAARAGRPVAIGVAHAGWRGVVAGVVPATVAALRELAPGCDLVAAIGPHIGPDAFQVGPDVVEALTAAGLDPRRVARRGPDARLRVDLHAAVADQLAACGVTAVDRAGGCTWSDPDLHSHRRDAERSGRLSGVIALVG